MTATLEGRRGTWAVERVIPRVGGGFDVIVSHRATRVYFSAYRLEMGEWRAVAEGWALRPDAVRKAPTVAAAARLGPGHLLVPLLNTALADVGRRLVAQGGGR